MVQLPRDIMMLKQHPSTRIIAKRNGSKNQKFSTVSDSHEPSQIQFKSIQTRHLDQTSRGEGTENGQAVTPPKCPC